MVALHFENRMDELKSKIEELKKLASGQDMD